MQQSCWSQFVIWQVFSETRIHISDSCDKIKPLSGTGVWAFVGCYNTFMRIIDLIFSHSSFAADIARSYLVLKRRDEQRICYRFEFHVVVFRNQNWIEDKCWCELESIVYKVNSECVRRQIVFIDSIRKRMKAFHTTVFVTRITKNWQRRKASCQCLKATHWWWS